MDNVRVDGVAVINQGLQRVPDLELTAPQRLKAIDDVKDGRGEHVNANERQVVGFFNESRTVPFFVDIRDAELLGLSPSCKAIPAL